MESLINCSEVSKAGFSVLGKRVDDSPDACSVVGWEGGAGRNKRAILVSDKGYVVG